MLKKFINNEPGDIVLIRFPQADMKQGKLRPALVVAISPSRHPNLLLALISSRLHQATPEFDEIINPSPCLRVPASPLQPEPVN